MKKRGIESLLKDVELCKEVAAGTKSIAEARAGWHHRESWHTGRASIAWCEEWKKQQELKHGAKKTHDDIILGHGDEAMRMFREDLFSTCVEEGTTFDHCCSADECWRIRQRTNE